MEITPLEEPFLGAWMSGDDGSGQQAGGEKTVAELMAAQARGHRTEPPSVTAVWQPRARRVKTPSVTTVSRWRCSCEPC